LERGCVQSTSRSTLKGSAASGIFQQAGFVKLLRLVPPSGTQPRSGDGARMRPVRLATKPENKRALCGLLRQNSFSQP
jgi:hypothetical protein